MCVYGSHAFIKGRMSYIYIYIYTDINVFSPCLNKNYLKMFVFLFDLVVCE